jgi:uncharacterized damage-inducible protein DinB
MSDKSTIKDLLLAMHDCLDALLQHVGSMPSELLTREVTGFGRPTIQGQLAHIIKNEVAWVRLLQGLPVRGSISSEFNSTDELVNAKRTAMENTLAYLASLTDEHLNSNLDYYTEEWIGPRRTPAFILQHVVTHAFHHKGQIVAMLRLLGHPAPDTDMQRIRA